MFWLSVIRLWSVGTLGMLGILMSFRIFRTMRWWRFPIPLGAGALLVGACSVGDAVVRTDFQQCNNIDPTCLPGHFCAGAEGDAAGANKWQCLPIEDASQFNCSTFESSAAPGGVLTECERTGAGGKGGTGGTGGGPGGGMGGPLDGGPGGGGGAVDGGAVDARPECTTSMQCGNPTPYCGVGGTCVACESDGQCADRTGTPFCEAGQCVGCKGHADCSEEAPLCVGATCIRCTAPEAMAVACSDRNANTPACRADGQCVQCTEEAAAACVLSTPVCGADNSCRGCTGDSECTGKGPEVCMDHDDGRCATEAETVEVQNADLQSAIDEVTNNSSKNVVTFEGITGSATFNGPGTLVLVGKGDKATTFIKDFTMVAPLPPALRFVGGTVYARGFTVTESKGGILIDGAGFDLRDLDVSGNSVGTFGAALFGGILINDPGTPARLRELQIRLNSQTGLLCASAIDIDDSVLAADNFGGDIDVRCFP